MDDSFNDMRDVLAEYVKKKERERKKKGREKFLRS